MSPFELDAQRRARYWEAKASEYQRKGAEHAHDLRVMGPGHALRNAACADAQFCNDMAQMCERNAAYWRDFTASLQS